MKEKLLSLIGEPEEGDENDDRLDGLKRRADGFFDVEEKNGYEVESNSEVFVRWSNSDRSVECRMMEDCCVVQRRAADESVREEETVKSKEEALRRAYLFMKTDNGERDGTVSENDVVTESRRTEAPQEMKEYKTA